MAVIARYDFNDTGTVAADSATGNGAQDGTYTDGAAGVGGLAVLDGVNDKVKVSSEEFQMPRGTLEVQFAVANLDGIQTIVSRDSVGETAGGYRAEVLEDGSILITHEGVGGGATFQTEAGFVNADDEITISYSWDEAEGGRVLITNETTGGLYDADTPAGLTMDQGGINQKWMVGAGQSLSDPDLLNNLNNYLEGSVEYFQLSDTVDNTDDDGEGDGLVEGTDGDDVIDLPYTGDPEGDRVDNGDALIPGDGPQDDRIYGFDGDDTIRGRDGDDRIYGGDGDDEATGDDGTDLIRGNDGDDEIDGGDGAEPLPDEGYPGLYPSDDDPLDNRDTLRGGAGDDTIRGGDDNDDIAGGRDNDQIDAGFDDDSVTGGFGNDTIIGNEGGDTIFANQGDDLVYGGLDDRFPEAVNIPDDAGDLVPTNNTDLLYGGFGNDTMFGRDDDDTLYGGAGDDSLDAGVDDDLVYGGRGNDTITGGEGEDELYGRGDRDSFIVGNGGNGAGDFIDGGEGGDDFDTLDLTGSGPLRIVYADDNPENGTVTFLDDDGNPTGTLDFVNIENVIPCFTPGTMVATPAGEVPVETLRAGDKVITRDNGIQTIAWTGAKHLDWAALCANPHLKPVLIRRGSLGHDLSERDMLVSPNHRMLVANDRTALYFEDHEVLVAAKHLVGVKGVQGVDSAGTTYIHFLCERHEVVLADGAWTESFQPGDMTLAGMGNAQRSEIFELFPELKTAEGVAEYTAARRTLKKHEARLLAFR
jgi:hypothetical protein